MSVPSKTQRSSRTLLIVYMAYWVMIETCPSLSRATKPPSQAMTSRLPSVVMIWAAHGARAARKGDGELAQDEEGGLSPMDHPPLQVKVVSADREVWKGESVKSRPISPSVVRTMILTDSPFHTSRSALTTLT
jgi:hypothetical protein